MPFPPNTLSIPMIQPLLHSRLIGVLWGLPLCLAQKMNSTPSLPHRFREAAFRRYEPDIAKIVGGFPAVTPLEPSRLVLSTVTYVARLRDALISLHRYRWKTSINMSLFDNIYKDIVISHRQEGVFAGDKRSLKEALPSTTVSSPISQSTSSYEVLSRGDLSLIGSIASKGLLAPGFKLSRLSQEDVDFLENNFDVRLDKNPDGTYTIS